jgi:hypothetical protein
MRVASANMELQPIDFRRKGGGGGLCVQKRRTSFRALSTSSKKWNVAMGARGKCKAARS